jgi:hypothetical protein
MAFGWSNAPTTMQRFMASVLAGQMWAGLSGLFGRHYQFSPTFDQHLADLSTFLSHLDKTNFSINLKEC